MQGLDAAPVELHGGADAVGAGAEDDDALASVSGRLGQVVPFALVGQVQVVGLGRELTGQGVDLPDDRRDPVSFAEGADFQQVCGSAAAGEDARDLEVGEAVGLGLAQQGGGEGLPGAFQLPRDIDDVLQLAEEPLVDAGEPVDVADAVAGLERFADGEDAPVRGIPERLVQVGGGQVAVADEAMHPLADHAQAFLDGLLEGAADRHHLADRLHAGTDLPVHAVEFAEVPARDLADDVVERGLEEGGRGLRDAVLELEQTQAQAEFGGHESQRVAGGLRGQGRGTAQARVDLDDSVFLRIRVEGVLDVAFADDAQMPDDADGKLPQEMVFAVGQGLGRSDHDALSGVDAERVEVLHVTDRDAVVVAVADHLVFDFLPALEALLDQDLRGEGEGLLRQLRQLRLIVAESRSQSAEGEG